jgi:hypothetical protein
MCVNCRLQEEYHGKAIGEQAEVDALHLAIEVAANEDIYLEESDPKRPWLSNIPFFNVFRANSWWDATTPS